MREFRVGLATGVAFVKGKAGEDDGGEMIVEEPSDVRGSSDKLVRRSVTSGTLQQVVNAKKEEEKIIIKKQQEKEEEINTNLSFFEGGVSIMDRKMVRPPV